MVNYKPHPAFLVTFCVPSRAPPHHHFHQTDQLLFHRPLLSCQIPIFLLQLVGEVVPQPLHLPDNSHSQSLYYCCFLFPSVLDEVACLLLQGDYFLLLTEQKVEVISHTFFYITLSLPNLAKNKFWPTFQISFCEFIFEKTNVTIWKYR